MTLPMIHALSAYALHAFRFGVSQLAASQSAVALKVNVNAATSGAMNITGEVAPASGWIVGVTIALTANKTAGVMTVAPTINGTALASGTGLSAVAVANTTAKTNTQISGRISGTRFSAGDLIGAKVTTDGSFEPTTNDVIVTVWVVFDEFRK